ncbi:prolactin releasing hormone 2 receptor [Embiotoca jacksoni]|uniref:prolactin releasing hormone 2 receptor n=1 Tax=Embiotoca jacksoni TaxID=100190 RepID=UPI003703D855
MTVGLPAEGGRKQVLDCLSHHLSLKAMDWEKSLNRSRVDSSPPSSSSSLSLLDSPASFSSPRRNSSQPILSASPFSVPSFSGLDLLFNLKLLFLPLYFAVVLIACSGNLLLLFLIWHNKKRHNTTNFLISNLALVDLVMCIFCVPLTASYAFDKRGWVFGHHMCHFVTVMQSAAVFAAVLSLMAIAVDRYVVVAYPIRRRAGCQFCVGLVVLIWLSALALSTPTALHTVYLDLRATGLQMAVCEEFWDGEERGRFIYSCFILFFSYFVPLAAVSISYCAISYKLKQRTMSSLTACPELRSARATWSRRRKKTFCLLLVSVLCFAFSWLPLQVVNLIHDLDTDFSILGKNYINVIQVTSHLFAMSSACYNPFIYASLHHKFLSCLCDHFLSRRRGKGKGRGQGSSILTMSHRMPRLDTSTMGADLPGAAISNIAPQTNYA